MSMLLQHEYIHSLQIVIIIIISSPPPFSLLSLQNTIPCATTVTDFDAIHLKDSHRFMDVNGQNHFL